MRKYLKMFLLAGVFAVLLCGSALAADPTTSGIYGLTANSGVTLEPMTAGSNNPIPADKTATIKGESVEFYAGAERIKLTYNTGNTGATEIQCLAFVLTTGDGKPTTSNIVYIDQQAATTDAIFTLYPSSLSSGTTYHIYASTTNDALKELGSFTYFAPYKLGDVVGQNGSAVGDRSITMNDARAALQIALKINMSSWTETQMLAANVDGNPGVGVNDARAIMQAALKMDTIFDWR